MCAVDDGGGGGKCWGENWCCVDCAVAPEVTEHQAGRCEYQCGDTRARRLSCVKTSEVRSMHGNVAQGWTRLK